VNVTKVLPTTTDPCGQIRFGRLNDSDEKIYVGKVDYQRSDKHTIFTRYTYHSLYTPTDYDFKNPISMSQANYSRSVQSAILGDTYLIGAGTVSTFRATMLRTYNNKTFFAPNENLGTWAGFGVKNFYTYPEVAKVPLLTVNGGFTIGSALGLPGFGNSTVGQFSEDASTIKGPHQLGFGVNFIYQRLYSDATTSTPGNFTFTATNTGLGLGDFMLGKPATLLIAGHPTWYQSQPYIAAYLQDTWKINGHFTANGGVRWEPYQGMREKYGRIAYFDQSAFDRGYHSTVYKNAPAGMLYPGDPGVPNNNELGPSYWLKRFAPRLGLAWDPKGDGRMTVRASYGLFYDFPHLYAYGGMREEPPFGGQVTLQNPPGGLADPWNGIQGGNPFPFVLGPNVQFPGQGNFVWVPTKIAPPYINQWGLSVQKQVGQDYLLSASYVGNNIIHVVNGYEADPVVYLPGASCVIAGKTYTPCSSTANTIQRHLLYMENPVDGGLYNQVCYYGTYGTRNYNGMLLSIQRRQSHGVTLQANYTWGHCIEDPLSDPKIDHNGLLVARRQYDRGNCVQDRRQNFNLSTVYETPQFGGRAVRTLATGWKISGIIKAITGPMMTVEQGVDTALQTGDQRPNLVNTNVYGTKTTRDYLNPKAFALSPTGTFGNLGALNIVGPGMFRVDMGLTRTFPVRESQTVEFRAEAFNLANHLNPNMLPSNNPPSLILSNNVFGQIQAAYDPRILQLALKYVF
jgi:hypothetical protein